MEKLSGLFNQKYYESKDGYRGMYGSGTPEKYKDPKNISKTGRIWGLTGDSRVRKLINMSIPKSIDWEAEEKNKKMNKKAALQKVAGFGDIAKWYSGVTGAGAALGGGIGAGIGALVGKKGERKKSALKGLKIGLGTGAGIGLAGAGAGHLAANAFTEALRLGVSIPFVASTGDFKPDTFKPHTINLKKIKI